MVSKVEGSGPIDPPPPLWLHVAFLGLRLQGLRYDNKYTSCYTVFLEQHFC